MAAHPIEGVLPVLHISYHTDGRIDLDDVARELDWVYQYGSQGCCSPQCNRRHASPSGARWFHDDRTLHHAQTRHLSFVA